ncbi:response regulator [Desulfuromonas acetoxidans]|uniref:Response regulator receiver protein n=1 Tax=Desulfuromonas acetoxidans (strain DSM 684 / 11070) TaxID=281689 RepID=Q1K1R1_DESA6|nr:response regulator [Desulfuromonas acetoxidans]EAT16327.1 response regulator receiver protein [Desulfuromonas acetoxidans DSM 684]MBF0645996.1 response regulator [Desulfuromonas acetoxidans]NVD23466.1 response regulator [Desulfuromonas acetoxidans]NVE16148.1 response regulator [Desulfuromonas acetoxidans]
MDSPIEILLVEDNLNDVELTLHAFKKNHIKNPIEVVHDGAEALDFIFCRGRYVDRDPSAQPRLILLDLKLPKVDGLEVLKVLKSTEETRQIPVVVLTSSREEIDMHKSYQLGVNSYIVKPVDLEQFVQATGQLGLYWLIMNQTAS